MNPFELFINSCMTFLAAGLFVYWSWRILALLRGLDERLDDLLDADWALGREILKLLRSLFFPTQFFLVP
jgi:hypothetical protein